METKTRNRLIIGVIVLIAGAVIGYQMYYSQTPPRHADHDHAISKLNAGGFLWVEDINRKRRNLVGRPGRVLVLHWFDPTSASSQEQSAAAAYAANPPDDTDLEVVFIAVAPSWEGLEDWARSADVAVDRLYLDAKGKTANLCGVRRLPETLIYDPAGFLAHQARGPISWTAAGIGSQIRRAAAGVDEIH
jgi:hypothetical protein